MAFPALGQEWQVAVGSGSDVYPSDSWQWMLLGPASMQKEFGDVLLSFIYHVRVYVNLTFFFEPTPSCFTFMVIEKTFFKVLQTYKVV